MASSIQRFDKDNEGEKAVGSDWTVAVGIAGSPISSVAVTPTNETNPSGDVDVLGVITFDVDRNIAEYMAQNGTAKNRYKFRVIITLANGKKYVQNQFMDVT